jgi:hypothetical protein
MPDDESRLMPTDDLVAIETVMASRLAPDPAAHLSGLKERWMLADGDGDEGRDAIRALSSVPAFVAHAERVLSLAATRAEALRSGQIRYVADALFTPEEARVAERALSVGLALDASWAREALGMLPVIAVAPTEARSVPSQAMVYALVRAIRALPTPEAIVVLGDVIPMVRHAGMKKKLTRELATARRMLATRPEIALRVPQGARLQGKALTVWLSTLERSWLHDAEWSVEQWLDTMHSHPKTSELAANLVWISDGGTAFTGPPGAFHRHDGQPTALDADARVRLWHPITDTEAERNEWRRYVVANRIDQPIRQVYREFYRPGDLVVRGLVAEAKQLLGVARTEGWVPDDQDLCRRAGNAVAKIRGSASLYPGFTGTSTLESVDVGRSIPSSHRWQRWHMDPARVRECDPVVVSELMRSADLLVSVSATALTESTQWVEASAQSPGGVLATRRLVLQHLLAELPQAHLVVVEGRYVTVADFRIHLATARVSRNGEPIHVEPQPHNLWAPPDPLLERILGTVVAIISCAEGAANPPATRT